MFSYKPLSLSRPRRPTTQDARCARDPKNTLRSPSSTRAALTHDTPRCATVLPRSRATLPPTATATPPLPLRCYRTVSHRHGCYVYADGGEQRAASPFRLSRPRRPTTRDARPRCCCCQKNSMRCDFPSILAQTSLAGASHTFEPSNIATTQTATPAAAPPTLSNRSRCRFSRRGVYPKSRQVRPLPSPTTLSNRSRCRFSQRGVYPKSRQVRPLPSPTTLSNRSRCRFSRRGVYPKSRQVRPLDVIELIA